MFASPFDDPETVHKNPKGRDKGCSAEEKSAVEGNSVVEDSVACRAGDDATSAPDGNIDPIELAENCLRRHALVSSVIRGIGRGSKSAAGILNCSLVLLAFRVWCAFGREDYPVDVPWANSVRNTRSRSRVTFRLVRLFEDLLSSIRVCTKAVRYSV